MSQYLQVDILGKVNNLPHFTGTALLPVFEAVSNSVHAIDEYGNLTAGQIIIRIKRSKQSSLLLKILK